MRKKILFYAAISILGLLILLFISKNWGAISKALFPLLLGIVIAYLLNPLVKVLESFKISRPISIMLVFFIIVIFLVLLSIYIFPVLIDNIKELSGSIPEIIGFYKNVLHDFVLKNIPTDIGEEIIKEVDWYVSGFQQKAALFFRYYIKLIPNILKLTAGVLLSFVLAYYFIRDKEQIKKIFLLSLPASWRNDVKAVGRDLDYVLSRFIQGQITIAVIIGILESAGLYAVSVRYALFLGLIGGVSNIIPYFGPYLGAVPAVCVALLDSPAKALWAAAIFVVVQQVDNSFLSPRIMQGKLGMYPVTTLIAVLLGGYIMGILGMVLAVPLTALLKVIGKRIIDSIA